MSKSNSNLDQHWNTIPTKVLSIWNCDDVYNWLNNNNMQQYVEIFQKHEINGYDLCYLTNEDLNEMNLSNFHNRNLVLRNVRQLTLEQLKIQVNYEEKIYVLQLDFDPNFTTENLSNILTDLLKIQTGLIFISTLDNEILMPNIKLVDLILLNPRKYRNLKIFSINDVKSQSNKFDHVYESKVDLYNPKANKLSYYDDNSNNEKNKNSITDKTDTISELNLKNDPYSSKYTQDFYTNNGNTTKYSLNSNIIPKIENYDQSMKNRNNFDEIGKKDMDVSISNSTVDNNNANLSNPTTNDLKVVPGADIYSNNKNATNVTSGYNYSERIKEDMSRQRYSSEKRNYRTPQYISKEDKHEELINLDSFNKDKDNKFYQYQDGGKLTTLDRVNDKFTALTNDKYNNKMSDRLNDKFSEKFSDKSTENFVSRYSTPNYDAIFNEKEKEVYKFKDFKDLSGLNDNKSKGFNMRPQVVNNFNNNNSGNKMSRDNSTINDNEMDNKTGKFPRNHNNQTGYTSSKMKI